MRAAVRGDSFAFVKEIHKVDVRSSATAYDGTAVLMGLPFLGIGVWLALAGFGQVPLPGKVHGPKALVGIIGLSFVFAGGLLIVLGLRGMRNRRRAADVASRRWEPWLIDHPWDPRGIRDRVFGRALSGIGGAAFMALFLVPFNWVAFFEGGTRWFVVAIVSFFDLLLLLVAGTVAYRLVQALRYGSSHLAFRRFPFHPGESLQVALTSRAGGDLEARLRFVEERFEATGSGRNRSTRQVSYELHGESKSFPASEHTAEVEIRFDVPDNPDWVTELSGTPVRYWELVVEAPRRGVDYRTTFPLPIYGKGPRGPI